HMRHVTETTANPAIRKPGVSVLTIPGDVGSQEISGDVAPPRFAPTAAATPASDAQIHAAASAIDAGEKVSLLVGMGARGARAQVLELAQKLQAPMVVTLKGKEGLERDNPYQVGQTGLLGNPAAAAALDDAD